MTASTNTRLTLGDVFPAFEPAIIDARLIDILLLCHRIGLPFPVEHNPGYARWWHSLHEVGHWAVKPPWYVDYSAYLIEDITIQEGDLHVPAGVIPGVGQLDLPGLRLYRGGNDVIPEIALYRDPTPGEHETRAWSLQVIELMGWPHPFDDNTDRVFVGNDHLHKPASARVWSPCQLNDLAIIRRMQRWGIDPLGGSFRAADGPDGQSFGLPFPRPASHQQMMANIRAVHELCGQSVFLTLEERRHWRRYLQRRWPDATLARWAATTPEVKP